MAFIIQSFGRSSVSSNTQAPRQWTYDGVPRPAQLGQGDTLATIKTSGYFDEVGTAHLQFGDLIYIIGTDGQQFVVVTSLNPVNVAANSIVGESIIVDSGILVSAASPDAQVFNVASVIVGDLIFATAQTDATGANLQTAAAANGQIGIEWDVNPGIINIQFMVLRKV